MLPTLEDNSPYSRKDHDHEEHDHEEHDHFFIWLFLLILWTGPCTITDYADKDTVTKMEHRIEAIEARLDTKEQQAETKREAP